jgi:50S ribosomal subunit-associated GTPase HflX
MAGATGSVGLRGPGESQLESDKRIIRKKIATLKKELLQVSRPLSRPIRPSPPRGLTHALSTAFHDCV